MSTNKKIILVGKPNSGKSLLFNQLTGLRQQVANFPGVTVELKSGMFDGFELVDFPGTYSLKSLSKDESIAIEQLHRALESQHTSLIVCNLDATKLERSLVFALQVQALAKSHSKGCVFALNMMDEVARFGFEYDTKALSEKLGSPVYAISAKTLLGIKEFQAALKHHAMKPQSAQVRTTELGKSENTPALVKAKSLAKEFGIRQEIMLKKQNMIDGLLLNSVFGALAFALIMFFLFQSIFTWAAPLMDGVEHVLSLLAAIVSSSLPVGTFNDFVNDALFGGVGAFLVFVPQIMILTLIIGLLEDSGYLARAALICHKPLSLFGLSGRSFIPYLSGHACAIPAIMAARTIESPRKRLITMMTVPLMSCSARLPVYALLIAILVPDLAYLGGWVNLQGIIFFVLYFGGILTALIVSKMIHVFITEEGSQNDLPFILELPSYRLPHWRPLFYKTLNSGIYFVKRAAPIIFMVSVVIWVLGYFPSNGDLQNSYLAMIGRFIEPVFAPLGIDWRYGVAILVSFLAREVFVGVLGTLFNIDDAEENMMGLAEQIQEDSFTLASGVALLAFYVIALQCVATVATLKGETSKNRYSWGVFLVYGVLAYCLSALLYAMLS
ncbi:ferrous iron transporter B [Ningiella sp. W23]|uniref:ferrous iron transporter B n=1 Tax=Ningiella sp. W23 TaxID=3023715 RepID=UPI00375632BE